MSEDRDTIDQVLRTLEPELESNKPIEALIGEIATIDSFPEQIEKILAIYPPPPMYPPPPKAIAAKIKQDFLSHLDPAIGDNYHDELIGDPDRPGKNPERAINRLNNRWARLGTPNAGILNNLACAHAWLFEFDEAMKRVNQAIDKDTVDEPEGTRTKAKENHCWIGLAQALWQS